MTDRDITAMLDQLEAMAEHVLDTVADGRASLGLNRPQTVAAQAFAVPAVGVTYRQEGGPK